MDFAVSEFLKGNGYLSLSGVNVLKYNNRWYTPIGGKWLGGIWRPYMGVGDHLVFMANEQTEYLPWDYTTASGNKVLIERFAYSTNKRIFSLGFYWFHLKPMKCSFFNQIVEDVHKLFPVDKLRIVSFNRILKHLDQNDDYHYIICRNCFNFVHNLDKKTISSYNLRWLEMF